MPTSYRRTPIAIVIKLVLLTASIHGCALETATEADVLSPDVDEIATPLFVENPSTIWRGGTPSNNMTLCFQPFDQNARDAPNWGTFTQHVQQLIEAAYEAPAKSGLSLSGWGLCSNWSQFKVGNQPSTTIEILVKLTNTDYAAVRRCAANHAIQIPLNCPSGDHVVLAISMEYHALDAGIVHEFAHVLGFDHEFLRADWDHQCVETGSGTVAGGYRLTPYDPNSIMNSTYCHNNAAPTDLDNLAVEVLFPASSAHSLVATASFVKGDGTIVARTNSTVTDEWTARGVEAGVVAVIGWTSNGAAAGTTEGVAATALSSGGTSYAVKSFHDLLGRNHTAQGQIITSNTFHAALTLVAL